MFNMLIYKFVLQVYGGMRGMKGLVYETSVLDPDEVSDASCRPFQFQPL